MKEVHITTVVTECAYNELSEQEKQLIDEAKQATNRSYAPYSKFSVGAAALLSNGKIVTGTNQENAAYPSGLCAERTALFYANSEYPDSSVETLVVAAKSESGFIDTPIPPCGSCRQVILETENRYAKPIKILLYGEKHIHIVRSASQLLPLSFKASFLE